MKYEIGEAKIKSKLLKFDDLVIGTTVNHVNNGYIVGTYLVVELDHEKGIQNTANSIVWSKTNCSSCEFELVSEPKKELRFEDIKKVPGVYECVGYPNEIFLVIDGKIYNSGDNRPFHLWLKGKAPVSDFVFVKSEKSITIYNKD